MRKLPVDGGVRLTVRWPLERRDARCSGIAAFQCGERVRAVVRLLPPESYHDPGVWSRADYLLDQGITSTASVAIDRVDRLGPGAGRVSGVPSERVAACVNNAAAGAACSDAPAACAAAAERRRRSHAGGDGGRRPHLSDSCAARGLRAHGIISHAGGFGISPGDCGRVHLLDHAAAAHAASAGDASDDRCVVCVCAVYGIRARRCSGRCGW